MIWRLSHRAVLHIDRATLPLAQAPIGAQLVLGVLREDGAA